ncbi:small GTP-binding domain protein [Nitzschia inconspicua]|uniref:Small GTP-binding domain protein n=1 Tax=Nitzschia inconspicua TaxID=303405 RepID=A0A9K3PVX2_9STRA|nr:small GTP-binding domain protein [Nitzschia inconspicua]
MPHVELPQAEFKVVMLGETFTGKTSLVLRFAEGYYRDSARNPTVGAFFITKRLTVNGMTAKIQIWDTAGQEHFKRLAPMYYKNAAAAIVCYDVTSPKSFETLEYWMNELQVNTPPGGLVIAMCATKCDLAMNPDTSQAEALAAKTGAMFLTTSAKTNTNVNYLFQKVTERVLDYQQRKEGEHSNISVTPLGITSVGAETDGNLQNTLSGDATTNENNATVQQSPSAFGPNRNGLAPLPTVPENGGDNRSPLHAKRQRPQSNDDSLELLDPAKTPSGDSDKVSGNVARCDPHSMLMCGGADSADGGGGCVIQ